MNKYWYFELVLNSLAEFDNDCGYLNVITFPQNIGDTARIVYYPTQDILDRDHEYSREWRTDFSVIKLQPATYSENYVSLNSHYILSVYNVNRRTDFFLKCKRLREYPRTNKVSVFVGK